MRWLSLFNAVPLEVKQELIQLILDLFEQLSQHLFFAGWIIAFFNSFCYTLIEELEYLQDIRILTNRLGILIKCHFTCLLDIHLTKYVLYIIVNSPQQFFICWNQLGNDMIELTLKILLKCAPVIALQLLMIPPIIISKSNNSKNPIFLVSM